MLRLFHRWKWKGKNLPKKLGLPAVLASSMAMACTCRIGGIGKVVQSQFTCVGLVGHWAKQQKSFYFTQTAGSRLQNIGFLAQHSWLMVFIIIFWKCAMISQCCYDIPKIGRARMRKKAKILRKNAQDFLAPGNHQNRLGLIDIGCHCIE
jgi:hypothetical protein